MQTRLDVGVGGLDSYENSPQGSETVWQTVSLVKVAREMINSPESQPLISEQTRSVTAVRMFPGILKAYTIHLQAETSINFILETPFAGMHSHIHRLHRR
eukprot:m.248974 g.248974  ORF g.248974 m.248974 type:complete len:100 (-) comp16139_c2_seq1:1988-2287(-)